MYHAPLRIARAENDVLFDEDGRPYIDLFSAHGAAWLGHTDETIAAAIAGQLGRVWITGGLVTAVSEEARRRLESFFPASHGLAGFYSTGMEAAEFALRLARGATGRNGLIGFERSMHGKSLATACLGWPDRDAMAPRGLVRLPFVPTLSEESLLERLAAAIAGRGVAAVVVEPIQGSGGGHRASDGFYREVARLCALAGTLLVFDEILTGFHRTGRPFVFSDLGVVPDVVLVGKALGNGFPVSAVVATRSLAITRATLPGSTFAGNALACAAVAATLDRMAALDVAARVTAIASVLDSRLRPLKALEIPLRGEGALRILEVPEDWPTDALAVDIYRRGVAIGFAGRYLRILPAATIDPARLGSACETVREVLEQYAHERNGPN
jgi:acetylornithine/succinyldiaminopimelate/putrescine aminotransferase